MARNPLFAHLAQAEVATNPYELPESAAHVWDWFLDLQRERHRGFDGAQPLDSVQIQAFFALESIRPEPWELKAIRRLDKEFMTFIGSQPKKEQKPNA